MKIVTTAVMRELEAAAVARGICELELMQRAGAEAAAAIRAECARRFAPGVIRRIVIVAGKGNNGGDGLVVANLLQEHFPVKVYSLVPHETRREPARSVVVPPDTEVRPQPRGDEFAPGDWIIDAINGIGLTTPLHGAARDWALAINAAGLPVAALDVPSGLNADTGAGDPVVRAEWTIALGAFKPGHFRNPAVGRLTLVPIGLPPDLCSNLSAGDDAVTAVEAGALFSPLPADTHKNRRGRLLIVAGSVPYGGAPLLAVHGALAAGVGMVRVATAAAALAGRVYPACVILQALPGAHLGLDHLPALQELAAQSDAILIGPGLGTHPDTAALVQTIFDWPLPLVADADALNVLAGHPQWSTRRTAPVILTPHPGEAGRLLPNTDRDRVVQAAQLAEHYRAVVILKGWRSVIAAPGRTPWLNPTGGPELATAGSGDVLAGLTAGLLATRPDAAFGAAMAACWLHGRAGEEAGNGRGLTADELPEAIRTTARRTWWQY